MLGNIKNKTTTPQVELLFRKRPYLSTADLYINRSGLYFPQTGNGGVSVLDFYHGDSDDDRCSIEWSEYGTPAGDDCPEGQRCDYSSGLCSPLDPADFDGDGISIGWEECGSLGVNDATSVSDSVYLGGGSWAGMKPDTIGTGNSIFIPGGWDVVIYSGAGYDKWDYLFVDGTTISVGLILIGVGVGLTSAATGGLAVIVYSYLLGRWIVLTHDSVWSPGECL